MDVWTPAVQIYGYSRQGGFPPAIIFKSDSGGGKRRRKRISGPATLSVKLKGTKAELEVETAILTSYGEDTAFKFKEPYDYTVTTETLTATTSTVYYLSKKYIDSSNLTVYENGSPNTEWTLSNEIGRLTFSPAPSGTITATYDFYLKVFLENKGKVKIESGDTASWGCNVKLLETLS